MQRKRGELVPVAEAFSDLSGPVAAIRDASPQALHHFTQADQVNQLVSASEADPALGFMARMMALCSLPRTNPGNRLQYKRVNGPYKLIMIAGGDNKLPFGNYPRLLLAWVSKLCGLKAESLSWGHRWQSSCGNSESIAAAGGKEPSSATKCGGCWRRRCF